MTSGASATSSAAYLRILSASAAGQRYSIFTFRPSAQPNCCSACRNAAMLGCKRGSSVSWPPGSTPMRRTRSPCCARAPSGHTAAATPSNVMNSRRLIASPRGQDRTSYRLKLAHWKRSGVTAANVRFGSKADICSAKRHVRFTPESDIKCDIWECPLRTNSGHWIFIRSPRRRHSEGLRDGEAKRLGGLEVDEQLEFG